ncbi:Proline dehydrogenase (Proline oxidase) / Delta-1-pyrroline-5-carboxylate dehydrogenase [Thioalkalivibrio nitratireducens DSM 14787]|uniref:Proline dehydrogenase (Proline oxidase) / Delta-1-pyrroline-5-carboxylate dehydrogenase n=1 Tax=Thioalkalivibrio nitratireducens (strain DSM 14787 / UNIQEM 213 / ALEN2) TaxID=1255043 RepID=L0DXC8_THIND|nr:proline dehydrogenase family protein [Thioalkalivibrio nitratireducens]AGA33011.1 Proline dehydrogenase (Proline oxidase) / Delta-1-pyrroline-5-carboxylate dehydrogenase [Thioalkalivibrio nitratireducens DSM 14787]
MIVEPLPEPGALRRHLRTILRAAEGPLVRQLSALARVDASARERVRTEAVALVRAVREHTSGGSGIEALIREYDLSSREGVVLMCLAEALLRVPDPATADRLIGDRIRAGHWETHLGHSDSLFVNASTWALILGARVAQAREPDTRDEAGILYGLVQRTGEPLLRQAVRRAMRVLGQQFVAGETLGDAWEHGQAERDRGFRHSYDMLGEAALTAADAERYFDAYASAIRFLGAHSGSGDVEQAPGISVKLSALHPRYVFAQRRRALPALVERLGTLAADARAAGVGLCVDAEEADRLDLSLDLIEAVSSRPELRGWDGLGLAIQAYQKRCLALIDWLDDVGRRHGRRWMVRLVKGAYWDTEIKLCQLQGLADYPVFTRKAHTDVSYLACARRLLDTRGRLYPQFATHNAHTVAWVLDAAADRPFEFQRLQGMGETLHEVLRERHGVPCRIYAPVGRYHELLPYLVRRLLENGANSSFVNRIHDPRVPVADLVGDPVERAAALAPVRNPRIPVPADLFGAERRNSAGVDLNDPEVVVPLGRGPALACVSADRRRRATGHTAPSVRPDQPPARGRRGSLGRSRRGRQGGRGGPGRGAGLGRDARRRAVRAAWKPWPTCSKRTGRS